MSLGRVCAILSKLVYCEAYVRARAQHRVHQHTNDLLVFLIEIRIRCVGCVHLQFCSSCKGGVGQGAVSHCKPCENSLDRLFLANAEGIFEWS